MLVITTPTHKQQNDVSCSTMSMGVALEWKTIEIISVKSELFPNFPNKVRAHGLSKCLQRVWFCLITFLYQFTSGYCSDSNSYKKLETLKTDFPMFLSMFPIISLFYQLLGWKIYSLKILLENKLSIYLEWLTYNIQNSVLTPLFLKSP